MKIDGVLEQSPGGCDKKSGCVALCNKCNPGSLCGPYLSSLLISEGLPSA